MPKRIKLSWPKYQELIMEVLERDNYKCQNPDCPGGWSLDNPHHIKFKSQGGNDTAENLTTLCLFCHKKAHGITLK